MNEIGLGCSRCKKKEAKKINKYFGSIFCDRCFRAIKKAVEAGRLPAFRNLQPKEKTNTTT